MNKKLFWILAALLAWFGRDVARGQTVVTQRPDCFLPLGLITAAPTNIGPFDNRTLGCNTWAIDYNNFGFTVLSLVVQTAPNATGNIPGAWSTFTAVTGINPNTATTQAVSTFGGTTSYFPWIRVRLASVTGTGSITGVLYGWKIPAAPPGGSGCIGTIATPCVVVGPTADGAPPTTSPVLVAGQDGTNIQTIKTDTVGRPEVVGAAAAGAAIAGAPVLIGGTDAGTTRILVLDSAGIPSAYVPVQGFALTDATSNTPNLPIDRIGNQAQQQTFGMLFNGATWDRAPGNAVGAFAQGTKTSNAAAPSTNNVGTLPCVANAAAPSWTEGFQVPCSADLSGNQRVTGTVAATQTATSTALADGLSNTEPLPTASAAAVNQRTFPSIFNGATHDRQFLCNQRALVTLSNTAVTTLVALSGSTVIRVCHVHATTSAPETISLIEGTGAACGTGTTTIDQYVTTQSFAMDFQPTAALRTTAANGLCASQSASQTTPILVIYAQF